MTADGPLRPTHYRPNPLRLSRDRILPLGVRTLIMGVVNVTPDSFHPGSRVPRTEDAVERALTLAAEGADILDIGGESSRPGAEPITAEREIERVLPVIEQVRKRSAVAISVDTTKSVVAEAALSSGADIVNDVSGFTADPAMPAVVARHGAVAVLMHMRGTPRTMSTLARYQDVVLEVKAELGARVAAALHAGIPADRIWIDPGIGFAKDAAQSLEVLSRLDEFLVFEKPLLVGLSRKSFLGAALGEGGPEERLEGSLAAAAIAAFQGAHVLRVHDVTATMKAARVADAIRRPGRRGV